jgi:hypothetical protein
MLARWVWRNDGVASAFCEPVAQSTRIIGSVGDELARRWNAAEDDLGSDQVVRVAGCEAELQRPADFVRHRMDFAGAPTPRTANGVQKGPPFAPPAER